MHIELHISDSSQAMLTMIMICEYLTAGFLTMLDHCFMLILRCGGLACCVTTSSLPTNRIPKAGGKCSGCSLVLRHRPGQRDVLCSQGALLSLPPRQGTGGAPSSASHSVPEAGTLANNTHCLTCEKRGETLKLEGSIFHKGDVGTGCSRRNSLLPKHTSSKDNVFLV